MIGNGLEPKTKSNVRFVTFNVNGIRTLFHYHPFRMMQNSLAQVFNFFESDVITLQELKTDPNSLTRWGKVDGFYSFISIPRTKKGYSGVGCWIRIPAESDPLFEALQVVKAEEGITGCLKIRVGNESIQYKDDPKQGIGGYGSLGIENEEEALQLDSEGRCVMVEFANNFVVISTYCPANSSLTDEGEIYRLKFLKVLFRRIRNLHAIGKKVLLMGDINVCRDLIDHAEALEKAKIMLKDTESGNIVEKEYAPQVREFIFDPSRPARRILNEMLADSKLAEFSEHGELIDSTRQIQGRKRLKMYTVWNTLKNSRPINYGSRIDYILVSAKLKDNIMQANIWPEIMGSDHCPVFADIEFDIAGGRSNIGPIPKFEARFKYNLNQSNILEMFARSKNFAPKTEDKSQNNRIIKKRIPPKRDITIAITVKPEMRNSGGDLSPRNKSQESTIRCTPPPGLEKSKTKNTTQVMEELFGKPPLCKHGEDTILKTSKTKSNPGKKFWTCSKPKGDSNNKNTSCGFFQWR